RRPLELLRVIIAFGGRAVREDLVTDALWPDAAGDAAHQALTSALHRLRGVLGYDGAVVRRDGHLGLDASRCWVDVWAVDALLGAVEAARSGAATARNGTHAELRRAAALYRGPFLDGHANAPWASELDDRLRRRLVRLLTDAARSDEEALEWENAVDD